MKMVIEMSSIYPEKVEELQKLAEQIEELTRYANVVENDTVSTVLKVAKQNKQIKLKNKLSEILEKLSGEDLLICSASGEPEDEEGFFW